MILGSMQVSHSVRRKLSAQAPSMNNKENLGEKDRVSQNSISSHVQLVAGGWPQINSPFFKLKIYRNNCTKILPR